MIVKKITTNASFLVLNLVLISSTVGFAAAKVIGIPTGVQVNRAQGLKAGASSHQSLSGTAGANWGAGASGANAVQGVRLAGDNGLSGVLVEGLLRNKAQERANVQSGLKAGAASHQSLSGTSGANWGAGASGGNEIKAGKAIKGAKLAGANGIQGHSSGVLVQGVLRSKGSLRKK